MEIAKRTAGQLQINALAPTQDSNELEWVSAANWIWKTFTDLPLAAQDGLAKEKLVPPNILLDWFGCPNETNGEILGWIAGSEYFSMFTLNSKNNLAKGYKYKFETPAVIKKSTIPSDIVATESGGSESLAFTDDEKALDIQIFPATIRRMILAIKNPVHSQVSYLQNTSDDSSTMTLKANFASYNKTHFIAVNATQKIIGAPGTEQSVLTSQISRSPWQVRVIYNKLV